MNHLLSIEDLNAELLNELVNSAVKLKAERGKPSSLPLTGQTWAMIFTKSSTRTRVSFEVGVRELGGSIMFLSSNDIQLGRGEPQVRPQDLGLAQMFIQLTRGSAYLYPRTDGTR